MATRSESLHRRLADRLPGMDRETYRAVLRHRHLLGDELVNSPDPDASGPSPLARIASYRLPHGALAGLVAALPITLIAGSGAGLLVALTGTAAGMLGTAVSHELTRRELRSLQERLSHRTRRLFGQDYGLDNRPPSDLRGFLDKVTDSLESALEGQIRSERDAFISTITSLVSALEARDPYTRNHSAHVAKLATWIGREMGLPHDDLYEIHLGGLLHDVGKIGIRDDILLKPAGLTRDEYEIMKTHPELGARMLSGLPGLDKVAQIVLHHHEMYDGRGYPDGLKGEEIPLGARIVAIADTYLSLVEDRPYRRGRSLSKVMNELRRVAGKQLDPQGVEALFRLLEQERRNRRGLFTEKPVTDEPTQRAA